MHYRELALFLVILLVPSNTAQELNCLNDLNISELLRLKHSMDLLSCSSDDRPEIIHPPEVIGNTSPTILTLSNDNPSALPLTNARSYPAESWNEKPSKLQTLFQVSITALAFLSFGGYLLCLIVQAIKSKGTTYFHPVATATTTTTNGQLKKIKIYRRSRRTVKDTLSTSANNTEEVNYVNEHKLPGPHPEDLYKALIYFAEGYAAGSVSSFE